MNWHRAVLIVVIVLPPATSHSQGFVPTTEQTLEFCQERPLEPEWMGNLSSRENYKRLVVQTIYRVQGLERVVEAGECSCATRFPPWDTAVQHFNDRYLGADRNAMREAEDRYLTRFNQLRLAAREICEADGNW